MVRERGKNQTIIVRQGQKGIPFKVFQTCEKSTSRHTRNNRCPNQQPWPGVPEAEKKKMGRAALVKGRGGNLPKRPGRMGRKTAALRTVGKKKRQTAASKVIQRAKNGSKKRSRQKKIIKRKNQTEGTGNIVGKSQNGKQAAQQQLMQGEGKKKGKGKTDDAEENLPGGGHSAHLKNGQGGEKKEKDKTHRRTQCRGGEKNKQNIIHKKRGGAGFLGSQKSARGKAKKKTKNRQALCSKNLEEGRKFRSNKKTETDEQGKWGRGTGYMKWHRARQKSWKGKIPDGRKDHKDWEIRFAGKISFNVGGAKLFETEKKKKRKKTFRTSKERGGKTEKRRFDRFVNETGEQGRTRGTLDDKNLEKKGEKRFSVETDPKQGREGLKRGFVPHQRLIG